MLFFDHSADWERKNPPPSCLNHATLLIKFIIFTENYAFFSEKRMRIEESGTSTQGSQFGSSYEYEMAMLQRSSIGDHATELPNQFYDANDEDILYDEEEHVIERSEFRNVEIQGPTASFDSNPNEQIALAEKEDALQQLSSNPNDIASLAQEVNGILKMKEDSFPKPGNKLPSYYSSSSSWIVSFFKREYTLLIPYCQTVE